jgi:hypothetical protein
MKRRGFVITGSFIAIVDDLDDFYVVEQFLEAETEWGRQQQVKRKSPPPPTCES